MGERFLQPVVWRHFGNRVDLVFFHCKAYQLKKKKGVLTRDQTQEETSLYNLGLKIEDE